MPSSSPAHAPVRSITLGSNFIGVGVQIPATAAVGLAVATDAAGEAWAVAKDDAARGVVGADGDDVEVPQPTATTRLANASPNRTRLPRMATMCIDLRSLGRGPRSRGTRDRRRLSSRGRWTAVYVRAPPGRRSFAGIHVALDTV